MMSPENRARMKAVLRDSLRTAYLPGSSPASGHGAHGGHHGSGAAGHDTHGGPTHGGGVERGAPAHGSHDHGRDERASDGARTPWGTPAISIASGERDALVDRFCQELEALAGTPHRADGAEAAADHIAAVLARADGGSQIVSWSMDDIALPGLGEAIAARGITTVPPQVPLADPERAARLAPLAALKVGLSGADAALAETGSLVLASGPGRPRIASLITPIHIAILHRDRILPSLPDLFRTRPDLATHGSNLIIITGPSRTADVEQTLVRGVHGPGEIHVIVVS